MEQKDVLFGFATPESCGVKSEWIENFLDEMQEHRLMLHSVMVVRGGKILAEGYYAPFQQGDLHRMYSASKSFISTAIGVLVGQGKVALDDPAIKYFPEYADWDLHPYVREMTVRNLLCMQTCYTENTYANKPMAKSWIETFFDTAPSHPAGTVYHYDGATSMLSAIVDRVAGKETIEFLKDAFLREAGFSENAKCVKTAEGYTWGASGIICSARDLGRLAQIYMDGGKLNGRQVLPEDFVREATTKQTDNCADGAMDFLRGHGYGYQIWVTAKNGFAFNGLGGQYAFCLPEKDLMFVCTGDIQGNNSATALIFSEVWHQIAERVQDEPFAEDPVANAKLQNRLENLSCHVPLGEAHVPFEAEVNGKWYTMNENMLKISRLMVEWNGESGVFHYVMDGVEKEFPFGAGKYELGVFPEKHYFGMTVSKPANRGYRCMSAGIWTEEKKLVLRTFLIDDYFGNFTITLAFKGKELGLGMIKTAQWFLDEYQGMAGGVLEE